MFLVMGTIFFLSHQSGDTLSPYLPAFPGADKICHLTIYGLLALTVLWGLGPGRQGPLVKVALKTVVFCLFYGRRVMSFIRPLSPSARSVDLICWLIWPGRCWSAGFGYGAGRFVFSWNYGI